MKVVQISDHERSGGAAIAARRLAHALRDGGHEVSTIVAYPSTDPAEFTLSVRPGRIVEGILHRLPQTTPTRTVARAHAARVVSGLLDRLAPDVVNVHNLHGAHRVGWEPLLLGGVARTHPTVWTLHDMWSFTGRCAYSFDCLRYIDGCDSSCPTPDEYPSLPSGQIATAWRQRRELLDEGAIVGVSPSRWLAREAERSSWRSSDLRVIPNGVPLETYRPVDRTEARRALRLPENRPIVLVAAERLDDPRKGVRIGLEALRRLGRSDVLVVTFGGGQPPGIAGLETRSLGFLESDHQRVLCFSAADLYVHPAVADNLPLVVQEAMACGTPTVGFPVGGMPELVTDGVTGWLATEVEASALSDAISLALESVGTGTVRETCRATAVDRYSLNQQADRYVTLFSELSSDR